MALNKNQTSLVTKVIIVFVALSFVALPVYGAVEAILSGSRASTSTNSTDQIAQKYKTSVDANNQALAQNPKDYPILVSQANTYSDWANETRQQNPQSGTDKGLFSLAISFYKKALAVKPGDPNVMTDMAIAQFYYGDPQSAVKTAEQVMAANPKFAPAFFNGGVFYAQIGQNAKAVKAFQKAIELDPKAQSVSTAQQFIDQLKNAPATATVPATSGK